MFRGGSRQDSVNIAIQEHFFQVTLKICYFNPFGQIRMPYYLLYLRILLLLLLLLNNFASRIRIRKREAKMKRIHTDPIFLLFIIKKNRYYISLRSKSCLGLNN